LIKEFSAGVGVADHVVQQARSTG